MKNAPGKTGQTPARTSAETNRRDETQPNIRRDQPQGRNPQTETDPNKRPQEPKRFEEQPVRPGQQPQGRGKDWHTTEEEDTPARKGSGRNLNPTDEKYLSEKDQYIPGRDKEEDDEGISDGPTESDERR